MISDKTSAYLKAAREEACRCFGGPISDTQWEQSLTKALQKLQRIIERCGDKNGDMHEPYYLGKLVNEEIHERAFSVYTMFRCVEQQSEEKEKSRHLSATTQINPPKLYNFSSSKVNTAIE